MGARLSTVSVEVYVYCVTMQFQYCRQRLILISYPLIVPLSPVPASMLYNLRSTRIHAEEPTKAGWRNKQQHSTATH